MIICSFSFVCYLIGYSNGEMRSLYLVICGFGFLLFLFIFHKFSTRVLKAVKSLKNKLKQRKKYGKNSEKV